jgi:hypothetical protein
MTNVLAPVLRNSIHFLLRRGRGLELVICCISVARNAVQRFALTSMTYMPQVPLLRQSSVTGADSKIK